MFYISPVVRFLLGLGAGLEITISPVYIHETTMRDMRDICGSFPQVGHIYLSYYEIPISDILPQLRLWLQWRLSIFPLVCHHKYLYICHVTCTWSLLFGIGGTISETSNSRMCTQERYICFPTDQSNNSH